jgi:hypothetical protein
MTYSKNAHPAGRRRLRPVATTLCVCPLSWMTRPNDKTMLADKKTSGLQDRRPDDTIARYLLI